MIAAISSGVPAGPRAGTNRRKAIAITMTCRTVVLRSLSISPMIGLRTRALRSPVRRPVVVPVRALTSWAEKDNRRLLHAAVRVADLDKVWAGPV